MKRPIGISVAACAALALAVAFTGCPLVGDLRVGTAKVQGTPYRPTFVFDKSFVLENFELSVYEDGRWPRYWGIGRVDGPIGSDREVQYGVVPKGFSAYMPAKHPTLGANKLYTFKFDGAGGGAGVRGGGTFAIVDKAGAPSIVQFDSSRSFDDILKEFEKLVQKPSR